MKSADADRLVVEFAALLNADLVLVVGSQAIHGTHPDPPVDVVVMSIEVDVVPLPYERYEKWFFYAHERLGDDSDFAIENHAYVDMIKPSMVRLPSNWQERCTTRELDRGDGGSVRVLYPEIHDLVVSKLLANRPQDKAFLRGLVSLGYVNRSSIETRLADVPLPAERAELREWARAVICDVFQQT